MATLALSSRQLDALDAVYSAEPEPRRVRHGGPGEIQRAAWALAVLLADGGCAQGDPPPRWLAPCRQWHPGRERTASAMNVPPDARWLAYWRIVIGGRAHLALPTAPAGSTIAGWHACGLGGDEKIATLAAPGTPAIGVHSVCIACAASASGRSSTRWPTLPSRVRAYRRRRWLVRWWRIMGRSSERVPSKPRL